MHASERSQEITQRRPQPFDGVGMHFTLAISIRISCPLMRPMTDRLMSARDAVVATPLLGVAGRRRLCRAMYMLRQGRSISALANSQATFAARSADGADHWRAVIVIGAVTSPLIRPTARRSKRVGVLVAFFSPRSETSRRSPSPRLSGTSRSASDRHSPVGAYAICEHPTRDTASSVASIALDKALADATQQQHDTARIQIASGKDGSSIQIINALALLTTPINEAARARACETAARVESWQSTVGTVIRMGENASRPKRHSLLHLTTRLSGKSFPKLITHQLFT